MYAKVLEAPVPRTPLTATAAVPVAVSVSAPVPASVAKEVAVVAMTPDKSVKIDTPSPTSVSGNIPLLFYTIHFMSTFSLVFFYHLRHQIWIFG